ncbi:hypothetical protein [Croceicoccus mobilis]|uniref:Uncharacterized protein n=1 Tax=Croceicoccus mobilis TaxID=1703339 RepID=A0A917DV84_9SPHN|nr:hypothetical protein [Croceicoccus mobilis]GGD73804.1 hypothetical protein GCM10010990_24270 [Croceicoccus mobilis]
MAFAHFYAGYVAWAGRVSDAGGRLCHYFEDTYKRDFGCPVKPVEGGE